PPGLGQPERERRRAAEEERSRKGAERAPVAEDDGGEGDEAATGSHVLAERAEVADRQVRASERGERARQDHGGVARPVHRDADGVGGTRMLADGPEAQPE